MIVEETTSRNFTTPVESAVDFAELPPEVDEEEQRRRQEEEEREKEGLNATIDSIFTLPDDEEVAPIRKFPNNHFDF